MAFKFESSKIDDLPLPHPLFEIFVYSPRLEGVHLRFGRVARGGIRWSDRPQDFRTEVLGLVKAQQVKNAVIVPVKQPRGLLFRSSCRASRSATNGLPKSRDLQAVHRDAARSHRQYRRRRDWLRPADTFVRDADDPYLVVAADKGTATFSDTANAISEAKHHWLGGELASGGSQGYDHKTMGITARGALGSGETPISVRSISISRARHSQFVGSATCRVTVFGNGMLLSPMIKLVAAFDHRDIFPRSGTRPGTRAC